MKLVINKDQWLAWLFYPLSMVAVVFVVLAIVFYFQKKRVWPYKRVAIMSAVEKKFYRQLLATFPHYYIFAQVQLSRVIRPPKGKNELKWLNKIWCLSLDYVILNDALETIAVIELDDASHLLAHRKEADQRKSKALKAAGLPLIRIKTNQLPTRQELLSLIG